MTKKIIIRADDVGYTPVNNLGAFEVFDHGVATAADVMLDTPGAVDALERLRLYPWISVGWHTHFWGSPVLPAGKVASLLDPVTGQFRSDIWQAEDMDFDELVSEMRAQLDRCVSILGRAPDTSELGMGAGHMFSRAKEQVCAEYGIVTHFEYKPVRGQNGVFTVPDPKWADRNIYWMSPGPAYSDLFSDSIAEHLKYDPVKYYTEDRGGTDALPEGAVSGQAWHPGYLDYYMCRLGDKGPNARKFLECRPIDTHALCSEELKAWIRENRVELMSFRDALYGTREYQEHLREIGSDLCVI